MPKNANFNVAYLINASTNPVLICWTPNRPDYSMYGKCFPASIHAVTYTFSLLSCDRGKAILL